jgi:hypothetical protein
MAIGRIPEPGTGIPESIIAAKGDILTGTANDTPAVLTVGTNGHTLVADSAEATGLKWAAPAGGGGFTSISSVTPSTSAQAFTSISNSYTHLCVIFQGVYASSDNQGLTITVNDISSSTYSWNRIYNTAGTVTGDSNYGTTSIAMAGVTASATDTNKASGVIWFYNYASDKAKLTDWKMFYNRTTAGAWLVTGQGFNTTTDAINKISFNVASGDFSGGNIQLYGVK